MDMFLNMNYVLFYVATLVIYIILFYLYFFTTKFTKEITVKEDFLMVSTNNKTMLNLISDTSNTIYMVQNKYLLLKFNASEILVKLEKNKTYTVKGYGLRIPFLDLYPNIISII
jgi:hypothetical protein